MGREVCDTGETAETIRQLRKSVAYLEDNIKVVVMRKVPLRAGH